MQSNIHLRLRLLAAAFAGAFIVVAVRLAELGDSLALRFLTALIITTTAYIPLILIPEALSRLWNVITVQCARIFCADRIIYRDKNSILMKFFEHKVDGSFIQKSLCTLASVQVLLVGFFFGSP